MTKTFMDEKKEVGDNNQELKSIVEAALFAAETPLTIIDIIKLFPDDAQPDREEIKDALAQLTEDYSQRGVELVAVGKAYRFQTRENHAPWLRKLQESKPPRYSRALLETLSIIAYRQPVTRGDIEEIRGVSLSSDTMRTLFERGWVKEVGHRDVPGKPALLATTRRFLEYFGLSNLKDLPPLQEMRTMQEVAKDMNLDLPLEIPEPQSSSEPQTDVELSHSAEIIPIDTAATGGKDADGDREAS